jgi:two-component system response regulator FixJ
VRLVFWSNVESGPTDPAAPSAPPQSTRRKLVVPTPSVFIVEDDAAVRDSLVTVMSTLGFVAVAFSTSQAFLDAIGGSTRGCVILDIEMPVMDGFGVLDAMAARGIDLPVIIISARLDRHGEARLAKAGVRTAFRKPLDIDRLMEATRQALDG